jgi:hypothetical protein
MLVEEIGALRDFVLDNLYMGGQDALFGMGFWMCSIHDIRIGALLLAWSMARHAWILHGLSHKTNRSGRSPRAETPLAQSLLGRKIFRKDPCLVALFSKLSLRGYGVSRSLSNSARHLMGRYDRARKRKFNFLPRDSRRAAIISQSYTVIAMVVMAAQVKCVR